MIFLFVLVFGVLFLFFNIRQISPGNKGSIIAGIVVALLPICFIFRDYLWASIGQAFLSVWLCESLLIYILWNLVRIVSRILFRKSFSKPYLILVSRVLLVVTIIGSIVICVVGINNNTDYKIRKADIVLNSNALQMSLDSAEKFNKPQTFSILFFSDLHIAPLFDKRKLERMIRDAASLQPDYIVFGGDFTDSHDSVLVQDGYDTLVVKLSAMAKRNAFSVNGNHEGYLERNGSDINGFMRRVGFIPLDDSTVCDSFVCFTGRTDYQVARSRDVPRKNLLDLMPTTPLPWILVDHEPKGIESGYSNRLPDFALSGHTHNGQFFPGTIIIKWVWDIAYGLGELDGVKWLVSSGVGSWGPPVRLGSETEIWFLTYMSGNRQSNE